MSFEHIDSWKNRAVFVQQLERNILELNGVYPDHWKALLACLALVGCKPDENFTFADMGCGVAAVGELLHRYYPKMHYHGYDYAKEAIDIAKEQWGDYWSTKGKLDRLYSHASYKDFDDEDMGTFDILHQAGLCCILPNGDECFDHLLSLQVPIVISQKMNLIDGESHYDVYDHYDIKIYEYHHNRQGIYDMIEKHGYTMDKNISSPVGTTLLLKKNV